MLDRNQEALKTIVEYLAKECPPIKNSHEKVTITQTKPYEFEIDFRNYDYHDYYDEDKYSHLHYSQDLESHVSVYMQSLPPNYQHPDLRYSSDVGEKGYCDVTVYLSQR